MTLKIEKDKGEKLILETKQARSGKGFNLAALCLAFRTVGFKSVVEALPVLSFHKVRMSKCPSFLSNLEFNKITFALKEFWFGRARGRRNFRPRDT